MAVRPLILVAFAAIPAAAVSAAPVDYVREVKPLLTQRCTNCHGESKQEGGLRADTAAFLREGGDSGRVIIPGKSAKSLLLQVVAGVHDDIPRMPYKKPPLNDAQIAVLKAWIDQGAAAPADEEPGKYLHWSFVPPVRVLPPAVKHANWLRNPVDHFVLARLEEGNLLPAPEADWVTLLRRVSLDLTGLPPSPAEVDSFLQDHAPGAYERAVERLLASPHYGERWARPWLDAARYADSNGYSIDGRRQVWKYRDWVVAALNRDLPFDQFVVEQLAGDLLPNATVEQKIATGFNRNTQINQEGGIDTEQYRIESVLDRVNTFGTTFLGLTIGCAQCHDHKFDPISQREYYQLFAFFNNTVDDHHANGPPGGRLEFPGELDVNEHESQRHVLARARSELERYLETQAGAVAEWMGSLPQATRAKLPPSIRAALDAGWDGQTLAQKRAVYPAFRSDDAEFKSRDTALTKAELRQPPVLSTLMMVELPAPRDSFVFIKGDFTRHGEKVRPRTPAVLPPLAAEHPTRLDLARWVADPANPLTARVLVNRIWQQYFGQGLVETENDFGTQGSGPTNPALLDWLATELVAQKWSWKAVHRVIVNSATYRQSSRARPDLEVIDPTNRLLARQARLRLDGELIRDVALAASGLLVPQLGGPPVFPPQPDGVMTLGQVKRDWWISTGPNRYRRGLYTQLWRATPHPALAVFDAPDGFSACTRRLRSDTPLQALTLLNDQQFYECAGALAERMQREGPGDVPTQINFAFRLCVARLPTMAERQRLVDLFEQTLAEATGDATARRAEAWTTLARVLLNLDETITRE